MVDSPPSPTGYLESVPLDGVSPFPPVERYDFKYLSQSSPLHEKLRQSQEEREETNSEASLTTTAYEAELEAQWRETQATFATLVNLLLIPWSSRELGKKFSHWLYIRHLTVGIASKEFWFGKSIATMLS